MTKSYWDEYLDKLSNSDYENDIKTYLKNIKKLSEIKAEKIEDEGVKQAIQDYIDKIIEFTRKYKNKYEVSKIVGFRLESNLKGRDYYFYIADQKMKASVYYIRYLNFINNMKKDEQYKSEQSQSKIEEELEDLKEKDENLDRDYDIEMERLIRKQSENLEYMNYMMFDNMMREIKFTGGAYQFMWHWTKKRANLYRYASYDATEVEDKNAGKSIKEYMKQLFGNVIKHMNNPSQNLQSYSENPYIDIYKYLKISNKKSNTWKIEKGEIEINFDGINNITDETTFEMIKETNINCIRIDKNQYKTFYEFIQENLETKNIAYAIEIYPTEFKGEKNEKDTTKNIKKYLFSYLQSWCDNQQQIMSYIADDKEVVTFGEIAGSVVVIKDYIPENIDANIKYQVKLKKNDIIALILKIGIEKNKQDIHKIINNINIEYSSLSYCSLADQLVRAMNNPSDLIIRGRMWANKADMYFDVKLKNTYFLNDRFKIKNDNEKKKYVSGIKAQEIITEEINDIIRSSFEKRYIQCCMDNKIIDFVWNFIKDENLPEYINTYNEYKPENNDKEIVLLKQIIFKGVMDI